MVQFILCNFIIFNDSRNEYCSKSVLLCVKNHQSNLKTMPAYFDVENNFEVIGQWQYHWHNLYLDYLQMANTFLETGFNLLDAQRECDECYASLSFHLSTKPRDVYAIMPSRIIL